MTDTDFFALYIPALEKALANDFLTHDFIVMAPDWWYPKDNYKEMDLFENENIKKYPIFNVVALYFDAKAHNFDNIDDINIDTYKKQIVNSIHQYKVQYNIN